MTEGDERYEAEYRFSVIKVDFNYIPRCLNISAYIEVFLGSVNLVIACFDCLMWTSVSLPKFIANCNPLWSAGYGKGSDMWVGAWKAKLNICVVLSPSCIHYTMHFAPFPMIISLWKQPQSEQLLFPTDRDKAWQLETLYNLSCTGLSTYVQVTYIRGKWIHFRKWMKANLNVYQMWSKLVLN